MCLDLKGPFLFNLSLIAILILITIFPASLNVDASSQPILEVEESFTYDDLSSGQSGNVVLDDIYSIDYMNQSYTDIMAGWFKQLTSITRPSYAYALRYDDGIKIWEKAVVANGYRISRFYSVENYVFVGMVQKPGKTSSLIVRLNESTGDVECYTIFDPAPSYNSKLYSVTYNDALNMLVAVGTANPSQADVPMGSNSNQGFLVLVDPITCSPQGQVFLSKISTDFYDVVVNNDPTSPQFGYTAVVGQSLEGSSGLRKAYILVIDNSYSLRYSAVYNTSGESYAATVDTFDDTFIIGGIMYNGTSTDGFLLRTDPLPNNSTAWWLKIGLPINAQALDAVNDVHVGKDGFIYFTGYVDRTSNQQNVIIGKITSNMQIDFLYLYGSLEADGRGITATSYNKTHVVGTISTPYPNQLQNALQGYLSPAMYPYQPVQIQNTLRQIDTVYNFTNVYTFNPSILVDVAGSYQLVSGLYIVIGYLNEQPTTTTSITATPTLTTMPTANVTTTYPPSNTTVIGPGPAPPTPYCIDLSTGTNSLGYPDTPGTIEDVLTDYPDWGAAGDYTVRVSDYLGWHYDSQKPARWITVFAREDGTPTSIGAPHPPVTYMISFTLQTPSLVTLNWTADNKGNLFIDGDYIQSANFSQGFSTYSTVLGTGTHTITVWVVDEGVITGLYLDGKACPPGDTNTGTTLTRSSTSTPTTIIQTGPGGSEPAGSTGESCPCQTPITQVALILSGLVIASTIITLFQIRKIR